MAETIKFQNDRFQLTIGEILDKFGIKKLDPGDKIWIKRHDKSDCRSEPYEMTSRLPWIEFNKCTIILSPAKPPQSALINNNAFTPNENKTYEQVVEEQLKLWQAKKNKKEMRHLRIPRTAENRGQAKLIIIKKKRRKRIELEKNKIAEQKNKDENKKPVD